MYINRTESFCPICSHIFRTVLMIQHFYNIYCLVHAISSQWKCLHYIYTIPILKILYLDIIMSKSDIIHNYYLGFFTNFKFERQTICLKQLYWVRVTKRQQKLSNKTRQNKRELFIATWQK